MSGEEHHPDIVWIRDPRDPGVRSAADAELLAHLTEDERMWPGYDLPLEVTQTPQRRSPRLAISVIALIVIWTVWGNGAFLVEPVIIPSEWAFEQVGLRDSEQRGFDGSGVTVCIVDTGVDMSHPDLEDVDLLFRDFRTQSPVAIDHGSTGHGTMMVGVLAANGSVDGGARGVRVLVAATLGENSRGEDVADEDLVADAIDWCIAEDADLLSLSLGGETMRRNLATITTSAVDRALDSGMFVIAAAGNDGGSEDDGEVSSPASMPDVIAVGAVASNGSVWEGSSVGAPRYAGVLRTYPDQKPEVVAPGVAIISTAEDGMFRSSIGTSVSTVFVAAGLAHVLEAHPGLTSANSDPRGCIDVVKMALAASSNPHVSGVEHDRAWGYGTLDVPGWIDAIQGTDACPLDTAVV